MARPLRSWQVRGLHKLGGAFFRDFAARRPEDSLAEVLAAQNPSDRLAIHALLWAAPVIPESAIRLLIRCEDSDTPGLFYTVFGKLHVLLRALCSVLYYAKNDPRRECGDLPSCPPS